MRKGRRGVYFSISYVTRRLGFHWKSEARGGLREWALLWRNTWMLSHCDYGCAWRLSRVLFLIVQFAPYKAPWWSSRSFIIKPLKKRNKLVKYSEQLMEVIHSYTTTLGSKWYLLNFNLWWWAVISDQINSNRHL